MPIYLLDTDILIDFNGIMHLQLLGFLVFHIYLVFNDK